ncbi:helix-turn-helix domain-containing protein [Eubacterium multiforme]|uniref:HTH cro/C1-type domain-containing protein n=1 Tax=Eubacterium multiforme TaxID=83339 RepID=A0ABT9UV67_9FIRM|nr:hypothetical protein [Eubacterium multiforme]MDQ0150179.1 hypothetical protein [Eubacterium multiforme]
MKEMYTYDEIDFGTLLEKLLRYSGQKNYSLASELGYDVSYISKWISNTNVPTSKNIKNICTSIAEFFIDNADDEAIERVCEYLKCKYEDDEKFQKIIKDNLYKSYRTTSKKISRGSILHNGHNKMNAEMIINPKLQHIVLNHKINEFKNNEKLNIILFTDIFSLGREDKLHLSGIKGRNFKSEALNIESIKLNLYLNKEHIKTKFDAMILLYMIVSFSNDKFKLYSFNKPLCSLLIVIKDCLAHSSIVDNNNRCIMSSTSEDKKVVQEMYDTLDELVNTSSKLMVESLDLQNIINKKYYIQSILNENKSWILGKITEHALSTELFNDLLNRYFKDDEELKDQLIQNHISNLNAMVESNVKILVYLSTLDDFILNGEINFFNKKIILTLEEREKCFSNIYNFFMEHKNIEIRLVEGNFVDCLKNFTDISLFLADNINYIRKDCKASDKQFLVINNKDLIEIFNDFYNEVWKDCKDVVISDNESILEKIAYYMNCLKLLKKE